MIDCHVHTARCGHASGAVVEYVEAAAEAGVGILTFTDHLPLPVGHDAGYAMPLGELDDYVAEVAAVRATGADSGVEVLLGIEADWLPEQVGFTRELLHRAAFDVVLGSVHFIEGWAFDDPDLRHRYDEWDPDELWARYFGEFAAAANSGLFDVMAHPDLVKKFGVMPGSDPIVYYEAAAHAASAAGVAVEVSTAGLRKPCGELYPSAGFLRALREAGVPVTVGSDAHRPGEVGYGWDCAVRALREAGYDSVSVFRDRIAEEVSLP